ncbi:hypothetical protein KL86DES1_10583 [uncultured Desulfovibrio sp.]|uniref:Uncharacterized protein n=1 Tax=uncultured Desulfovibrio sp. TaxID=167968 RepID=A0A212L002_9BACT|nr:hypothetical protein KL86DES1_10583 [uncultured Desulfovibrio sp.]VZH32459.1 conserved protein of unknown function [Desulfovibrio sp. 86]
MTGHPAQEVQLLSLALANFRVRPTMILLPESFDCSCPFGVLSSSKLSHGRHSRWAGYLQHCCKLL